MVNFRVPAVLLSLASVALSASLPRDVNADGLHAPHTGLEERIPITPLQAYTLASASKAQRHVDAISAAAGNATDASSAAAAIKPHLNAVTLIFTKLVTEIQDYKNNGGETGYPAKNIENGLQAIVQAFVSICLAIYKSPYGVKIVVLLTKELGRYCQGFLGVLLELDTCVKHLKPLVNSIAGTAGLTPQAMEVLHLDCLSDVLKPCRFGPIMYGGPPQCPCPRGKICPL